MINEYGYEYDAVLNNELWNRTRGKTTEAKFHGAYCLRSGRDALKAIAREYKPTIVLLPSISCNSMALPFHLYHHTVRYYRMNDDYSVNIESIFEILSSLHTAAIFLYMDYFGNSAIRDDELKLIRSRYPETVFVEDRTHNLLVYRKSIFKPEYIMASLRKWVNIPDGGLLWVNKPLQNITFTDDNSFSETRLGAQCMRNEYLKCGDLQLKDRFRHIFSTVSEIIDRDPNPAKMSEYAFCIAEATDWDEIRKKHRDNAEILVNELQDSPLDYIQKKSGNGDIYVAVLVEHRDELQRKLSSMGIYCTIIWPLNEEQKSICDIARYTEANMLAIYCDQRYSADDMRYVASIIKRLINEQKNNDSRSEHTATTRYSNSQGNGVSGCCG